MCLCALGIIGGVITYQVYLGVYAYNNPDPTECWWAKGLDHSYTSETAAQLAAGADVELTDVHNKYVTWFVWGFWTSVSPCIAIPVIITLMCLGAEAIINFLAVAFGCGYACSGLFWFIFGIVWRWGKMGQASTRAALKQDANADAIAEIDARPAGLDGVEPTAEAEWGLQAKGGAFMNVILWIGTIGLGIQCLMTAIYLVKMRG